MKSLLSSLAIVALLGASAVAAPVADAEGPLVAPPVAAMSGEGTTVIVIGPFPLAVYDAVIVTDPLEVSVRPTAPTYFNLGFFEVDTVTDMMWPWGMGLITAAQVPLGR